MRRRDFITLLGGAAVAWPLAVRAQQSERVRRIGVLRPIGSAPHEELKEDVREFGYGDGRNIPLEIRYAEGNLDRALAAELVRLNVAGMGRMDDADGYGFVGNLARTQPS